MTEKGCSHSVAASGQSPYNRATLMVRDTGNKKEMATQLALNMNMAVGGFNSYVHCVPKYVTQLAVNW